MALSNDKWVRLVVEVGVGVDQHGQDPTKAAAKAIRDAIHRVCIPALVEEYNATPKNTKITVEIGVPYPDKVDVEILRAEIPLKGELDFRVREGGLKTCCVSMREYGDKTSEMLIAVAAITVSVKKS